MMGGLIPADFHLLRPWALLALIPAALIALAGWRAIGRGRDDWTALVDAHLLRHLAVRGESGGRRWPLALLLVAWVLACLALAGPTWQKLPSPALERLDPTVMALSLGHTMDAADASPNRLTAARHKLEDLIARMRGGQLGLIVYADVPFVASPLTEDGRIISLMLPELSTDLMPVTASRPDLAIAKAVDLLKGADAREGRIVLVTDGVGDEPDKTRAAARAAAAAGYKVSVIGVGTATGAALRGPDGASLKGAGGAPTVTRMDQARLTELAADGLGTFTPLTVDGRDLDAVFATPLANARNPLQRSEMSADQWADMGPYLLLLLLVLAPLAFRRGVIAALLLATLGGADPLHAEDFEPPPAPAAAADTRWSDLWQRPDQQAAEAFRSGDFASAAGRFEDPSWQASALYKAGRYDEAAAAFARLPGGDYNRGNALARAGKLEEAVAAYDAALKADPGHADALFNRDLVLQLIQRQKDEEEKKKQSGGGGGGQQKDQKSADSGKSQPDKGKGGKGDPKPGGKGETKPDSGQPNQPQPADKGEPTPPQNPAPQPEPKKPEPAKPDPAKPDPEAAPQKPQPPQSPAPANPEPPKPEPPKPEPPKPEPPKPEPAKPAAAQPAPAPPAREAGDGKDDAPPSGVALKPMSEQDQNSEQALRMVPDDPAGLLRARIRAHYGLGGSTVSDDN